jgi:hypothetical protein
MSRITTFIDTLLDTPTTADLGKVVVVIAAHVVGVAGWYRMWALAWGAADPVLAVQQGAGMALLVLLLLVVLTVALGLLVDVSGMERVCNGLARIIAMVVGATSWLAFLGLLHGLWLLVERVEGWLIA